MVVAGADALGLNFVTSSTRFVSLDTARRIARKTAGAVVRVGVFADAEPEQVERVLDQVDLDVLQFHGSEQRAYCERWKLPYIKAVSVRGRLDGKVLDAAYPSACCVLLDTFVPDMRGGTGERFDLSLWPHGSGSKLALAGGLDPSNVGAAVTQVRPYAVDVSSGVEGTTKGIKSAQRIIEFVQAVRRAE